MPAASNYFTCTAVFVQSVELSVYDDDVPKLGINGYELVDIDARDLDKIFDQRVRKILVWMS